MKIRSTIVVGFLLVVTSLPGARAQGDTELKTEIKALHDRVRQSFEARDLEGIMSTLTGDFQEIFMGQDREMSRSFVEVLFEQYAELRAGRIILDIDRTGEAIRVVSDTKYMGKPGDGDWEVIFQGTEIELLVREGDSLRIARSTNTDKARLSYVDGHTYKDKQTGLSFSVPDGWQIFPTTSHPILQGGVFVLAPDWTSAAMIGYVKVPAISAKQAAEGDEALGKTLSNRDAYRLIKSVPINVGPYKGYEIESKFFIQNDRERHRRRIYFKAGGLLYLLCFDAMPFRQWDSVKDGFQYILDSLKMED